MQLFHHGRLDSDRVSTWAAGVQLGLGRLSVHTRPDTHAQKMGNLMAHADVVGTVGTQPPSSTPVRPAP